MHVINLKSYKECGLAQSVLEKNCSLMKMVEQSESWIATHLIMIDLFFHHKWLLLSQKAWKHLSLGQILNKVIGLNISASKPITLRKVACRSMSLLQDADCKQWTYSTGLHAAFTCRRDYNLCCQRKINRGRQLSGWTFFSKINFDTEACDVYHKLIFYYSPLCVK